MHYEREDVQLREYQCSRTEYPAADDRDIKGTTGGKNMAFTIAKMLQLPAFRGASVIAGSKGINVAVGGVTMLESTDFHNAVLKGELVLTSSFFLDLFRDSGVNYILECYKKHAVGLCIKEGSPEDQLPGNILAVAEQLHFPVIVLNSDVNFCQIINAVTYEVLRREGYNQTLSYEENFFQELITSVQDRDTFFKRGAMLGLRQDEQLCALLLQPDDDKLVDAVCSFCRDEWEQECYTLTKNGRVMVALRLTISEIDKNSVIKLARVLLKELETAFPEHQFRVGIGRCYKELINFNKSFSEACSALSFSMLAHSKEPISHFDDLGVYRILFDYKNREELFHLYRDTVGVISEYDQKNQTEYLDTIRTYFSQNYSINNTAKKMFVHYNTILYRLNKIKALFGIDLNNEEERINLYVSLRLADSQNLWKTF